MTHVARPGSLEAADASAPTGPTNGWHWREWLCEAIGTAILLYCVVTAKDFVIRVGDPVAAVWPRVAIVGSVAGLVVVLVARSPLGRRSGAHLNPAVTLGLAIQGSVSLTDCVAYPIAQCAGGIGGVFAARMWGGSVPRPAVHWAVIAPVSWIGETPAALIELGTTALQLTAVYGCLASRRNWLAPYVAGFLLCGAIAGLGPISGAGFNPVRGLDPDVAAGSYPALWIYLIGPVFGALVAALAVRWVGRPRTGKLVHDATLPCFMSCTIPHTPLNSVAAPGGTDGH